MPPLSGENENKKQALDRIPDATQNRAAQITVLLRRNGGCSRTHPGTKGIDTMVADGTTDLQILAALETAKERRKAQGSTQPITVAYLLPIIADQRTAPAQKKSAVPPFDDWHKSEAGIDRKAQELGMYAYGGEDYRSFRDRIFAEIRKRESQGATQ